MFNTYMYKVSFRDGKTGIPRAIKIYARNRYEACEIASKKRNGTNFSAVLTSSDEHYVTLPIRPY